MAIAREGSIQTLDDNAESGSTTWTVPANTDLMIVFSSGWDDNEDYSNASLTIGGDAMTVLQETSNDAGSHEYIGMWYRANPSTGSQTFAFDWNDSGGARNDGHQFVAVFYSGVDTADPFRDSGRVAEADDVTGLSAQSGDRIIGAVTSYNDDTITVTDDSQTEITVTTAYNQTAMGIAEEDDEGDWYSSGASYPSAVAAVMKPASGGAAYERTVTDTVGLADTLTTARNLAKSVSDPVGLTDTVATARTLPRSIADALGITDSVNALKKLVRTISDAIGLTDTLSTKRGLSRTVNDPAAATDSLSTARELARTFAETADITDDISTSRSIVKTISDTLGITDVLSRARGFFRTITDALGITDSIAAEVTEYTPGESDIVLLSGSIARRVSLSGGIEREIDSSGRIARTVRIAGTLR